MMMHPIFQEALAPFMPPSKEVFDEAFFKEVDAAMQQTKLDKADGNKLARELLAREIKIRNCVKDDPLDGVPS